MSRFSIVILLAVLLVGCDARNNWFYHPVEFNGEVEQPRLVLNGVLYSGQKPRIYVGRSTFFLSPVSPVANAFVHDARVEVRMNGGEWLPTEENSAIVYRTKNGITTGSREYWYEAPVLLSGGDHVEVRVLHPTLGEAHAAQVLPQAIQLEVECTTPVDSLCTDRDVRLADMKLRFRPDEVDSSQVLCLRATCYYTFEERVVNHRVEDYHLDVSQIRGIYTRERSAMDYDAINLGVSEGYYGGTTVGLMIGPEAMAHPISVHVPYRPFTNVHYVNPHEEFEFHRYQETDSLVIDAYLLSRDAYLRIASLALGGYIRNEKGDPFVERDESGAIVIDFGAMFDRLGGMEGVQLYNNVEGAQGALTSAALQRVVVYRRDTVM